MLPAGPRLGRGAARARTGSTSATPARWVDLLRGADVVVPPGRAGRARRPTSPTSRRTPPTTTSAPRRCWRRCTRPGWAGWCSPPRWWCTARGATRARRRAAAAGTAHGGRPRRRAGSRTRCPVCAGPLDWTLVDEDARLDPRSAYAASKLAQEHYAASWARQSGGRPWSALRYHNVYGPRDAARHAVLRGRGDVPLRGRARRGAAGLRGRSGRCATSCTSTTWRAPTWLASRAVRDGAGRAPRRTTSARARPVSILRRAPSRGGRRSGAAGDRCLPPRRRPPRRRLAGPRRARPRLPGRARPGRGSGGVPARAAARLTLTSSSATRCCTRSAATTCTTSAGRRQRVGQAEPSPAAATARTAARSARPRALLIRDASAATIGQRRGPTRSARPAATAGARPAATPSPAPSTGPGADGQRARSAHIQYAAGRGGRCPPSSGPAGPGTPPTAGTRRRRGRAPGGRRRPRRPAATASHAAARAPRAPAARAAAGRRRAGGSHRGAARRRAPSPTERRSGRVVAATATAASPQAATAANIASAETATQMAAGASTRNGAARRARSSAPSRRRVTRTATGVVHPDQGQITSPVANVAAQAQVDEADEEQQRARRVSGRRGSASCAGPRRTGSGR